MTLLLFVIFLATFRNVCTIDDDDALDWKKEKNGRLYMIIHKPLAWSDAKHECEVQSGKLITIESLKTQGIAKHLIRNQQPTGYWTGLVEDLFKHWTWEGIGNPKFLNWESGQPLDDADLAGCAAMNHQGKWHVSDCEVERKSICQKEADEADNEDEDNIVDTLATVQHKSSRKKDSDTENNDDTSKKTSTPHSDEEKVKHGHTATKQEQKDNQNTPSENITHVKPSTNHDNVTFEIFDENISNKTREISTLVTRDNTDDTSPMLTYNTQNASIFYRKNDTKNLPIFNSTANTGAKLIAKNETINQNNTIKNQGISATNQSMSDINNSSNPKAESRDTNLPADNSLNENNVSIKLNPDDISNMAPLKGNKGLRENQNGLLKEWLKDFRVGYKDLHQENEEDIKSGLNWKDAIMPTHSLLKALKPASNMFIAGDTRDIKGSAAVETFGGTGNGLTCSFPFIYNGDTVSHCQDSELAKGRKWCAVSDNYDRDGKWGYCDDTQQQRDADTLKKTLCDTPNGYRIQNSACDISDDNNDNKNNNINNNNINNNKARHHANQTNEIDDILGTVLEKEGLSTADQSEVLGQNRLQIEDIFADANPTGTNTKNKGTVKHIVLTTFGEDGEKETVDMDIKDVRYRPTSKETKHYISVDAMTGPQTTTHAKHHPTFATTTGEAADKSESLVETPTAKKYSKDVSAENVFSKSNEELVDIPTSKVSSKNKGETVDTPTKIVSTTNKAKLVNTPTRKVSSKKKVKIDTLATNVSATNKPKSMDISTSEVSSTHTAESMNLPTMKSLENTETVDTLTEEAPAHNMSSPSGDNFILEPTAKINNTSKKKIHAPKDKQTSRDDAQKETEKHRKHTVKLPKKEYVSEQKGSVIKTVSGGECVFPFVYEGETYFNCIKKDGSDKTWCSLTSNYDKMPKWSYCCEDGQCPNLEPTHKPSLLNRLWKEVSTNKKVDTEKLPNKLETEIDNPTQKYLDKAEEGETSEAEQDESSSTHTTRKQTKNSPSHIVHNNGEEVLSIHSGLKTYGGNAKGTRCVIPFVHDGQTHMKCIPRDDNTSWCATTHNYDRMPLWGNCCDSDHCDKNY